MKTIQQIEREAHTYRTPWTNCPRVVVKCRNTTGMRYSYEYAREVFGMVLVLAFMGVMAFASVAMGG